MTESTTLATKYWTSVARLDPFPDVVVGAYDRFGAMIRSSYQSLAENLAAAEGTAGVASRIQSVLAAAPQVVSYGEGYQSVVATTMALIDSDIDTFHACADRFTRFEAATAALSGGSGTFDLGPEPEAVVPIVGTFRTDGRALVVSSGEIQAERLTPERVGAIRVNPYDPDFRQYRATDLDRFDDYGVSKRLHDEIVEAAPLARRLVPGLFDRYLVDLVPLRSIDGAANAGTDEGLPFTVFAAGGRGPVDLIATLAHEEAHSLINMGDKILGPVLPRTERTIPVPWKPGMYRDLGNVIHGLISFARAAQVRLRAAELGLLDAVSEEALARETRWVTDVSDHVLRGDLGPLDDDVEAWIVENRRYVRAVVPAVDPDVPASVYGGLAPTGSDGWYVFRNNSSIEAASSLYPQVVLGRWDRGVGEYHTQDRVDQVTLDEAGEKFFLRALPERLESQLSDRVELRQLKLHRLRDGDSIHAHSDDPGPSGGVFRAVVGVSNGADAGGRLTLLDDREAEQVSLPLRHGDVCVFDLRNPVRHEVSTVRGNVPRYTAVATYSRAAH